MLGWMSDDIVFCVFFFKQKTAYEMRISDWSSDVCSSDLVVVLRGAVLLAERFHALDHQVRLGQQAEVLGQVLLDVVDDLGGLVDVGLAAGVGVGEQARGVVLHVDRKSTRLNCSD